MPGSQKLSPAAFHETGVASNDFGKSAATLPDIQELSITAPILQCPRLALSKEERMLVPGCAIAVRNCRRRFRSHAGQIVFIVALPGEGHQKGHELRGQLGFGGEV
jgi:hypothetical protein